MVKATVEKIANVTARDIQRGERGMSDSCALALSATRLFPGKFVIVTPNYICVYDGDDSPLWESEWTHDGAGFVDDFDNGFDVQPRKVKLRLYYKRVDDGTSTSSFNA